MSLRWFYPQAPWSSATHQKVRVYGDVMPLVHVASIIGCDKIRVTNVCKGNRISYAPSVPGVEYGAYLYVSDVPAILRSLKWSEEKIEKGMSQLLELVNRPPRSRKSKQSNEQEEEEEEEKKKPSVSFQEAEPNWARELRKEFENMRQEVTRGIDTCFAMVGSQAVPFYFGTKKWKDEKKQHIQAYIDTNYERWTNEVKAELRRDLAGPVEEELRTKRDREYEENMEKEDVYQMVQYVDKRRKAIGSPSSLPVPEEISSRAEDEAREFIEIFRARHQFE